MSSNENLDNGVNEAGSLGEGLSLGRCSVGKQHRPGRHPMTAKRRWTTQDNLCVMKCYYKSEPDKRGYRKRMHQFWIDEGRFEASEQRVVDQKNNILSKGWLSTLELEALKRTLEDPSTLDESVDIQEENDVLSRQEGCISSNINTNEGDGTSIDILNEVGGETNVLLERVNSLMISTDVPKPKNLRKIDRMRVKEKVTIVNDILKNVKTRNITETNKLIKVGAVVTCELLGIKDNTSSKVMKEKPFWQRRIERKISQLRKDLSLLQRLKNGKLKKTSQIDRLQRSYCLKKKSINLVMEEIKQRIVAKSSMLKRYKERVTQYRQNRLFQDDRKRLFEELDGQERKQQPAPDAEKSRDFWNGIWGKEVKHNDAEWIEDIDREMHSAKQEDLVITPAKLKKQLQKMSNWKAPGPDDVQGFWLKSFDSLHGRIAEQLQWCVSTRKIPEWLTVGRTVLIMKDEEKGNDVSNYRPITCLPLMWKLLTGVISDELYHHLINHKLLPEEQKGCKRKSRGTKDQLLIDKMVLKNCRRRKVGLSMVWIDYKKAYDMVPHSWILKSLEMVGVADNIKAFLDVGMGQWKTNLTSGESSLGQVQIKRGIFQGDSLSPLLFIIAMIPLTYILREVKAGYDFGNRNGKINHLLFMDDLKLFGSNEKETERLVETTQIFSKDICMEFGVSKCAFLTLKRGKVVSSEGLKLSEGIVIKELDSEKGYKYLGVVEASDIRHQEMKTSIRKEYFRRVRKIVSSKLNAGNTIEGINSRAVSLVRYTAGIVNWTKEELQNMDRKTRKLMTMNRMLHPQSDVNRLYVPRKDGGRGLLSVQDCVELEIISLCRYVSSSKEDLLSVVNTEKILKVTGEGGVEENKESRKLMRLREWKEKALHGKFMRDTEDVRDEMSFGWVRKGYLKKETEGMIFAAQDQALRTNWIKKHIDRMNVPEECRMCGHREESITHLVAECQKLAQTEYKRRHDNVARIIHLDICKQYNLVEDVKWYNHKPERVLENEHVKVLWDVNIQTDHVIESRRPDIILLDKELRKCFIVDIACPGDSRVGQKEIEKIQKYDELRRELKKLWKLREVRVIPIVVGALGVVSRDLKKWLKELNVCSGIELLQKACLLGTARLIRKVFET